MVPAHGFTAVDQQADPEAWVAVLDKLSAEPIYRLLISKAPIPVRFGTPDGRYCFLLAFMEIPFGHKRSIIFSSLSLNA